MHVELKLMTLLVIPPISAELPRVYHKWYEYPLWKASMLYGQA